MKRAELVATLELVSHALADTNLVPVFQCFAFDTKTVSAYSDTIGIIAPCKTTEAFAVNGATLLGLLKNSHAEDVEFSIESKQDLAIKTGKSRFKLPYFTKDDFVFTKPGFNDDTWIEINDKLLTGMEACLMTSSRDLAQPKLLGVNLQPYGKCMALYSCDGDALTRYVIPKTKVMAGMACLIPNVFCEALIKIFKETKAEKANLQTNEEWAYALLDTGYHIYGRLIEATDPVDYEELITKTVKGEVNFVPVPKGLDHALSRARVVADPESAKTVLDVMNGLKLTTDTQMGLIKDFLPYGKHPDAVTANVSAAMVQRAIGLCDEMAILDRCTVYRHGEELYMVVSNMG
jgi:DNA polymerase III sliding clamp (beta) subunit (PCNA family)